MKEPGGRTTSAPNPGLLDRLRASQAAGLATAALAVTAATLLIYPLQSLDPGVSSGVLYVLGVLLVSVYWGLPLGLLTSFASAFSLFFFHSDPTQSFRVHNAEDLVAIGTLLGTSIVASVIADRARLRARDAEERLALQEELRRRDAERIRLEEVQASRARVLAAADGERKRVVRDLHDGAQQRLVHTVVTLKLTRRALERQDPEAASMLDEALQHAIGAVAELRELAHGIMPSVLARGGLRAGVEAVAERMPIPVGVEIELGRRLPTAVEATAYFVVAESLTNVAKHASARHADVRATVGGGVLRVEVHDDGDGGARIDGDGLTGLGDRLAVLGGRLTVDSPRGDGTHVIARIPVGD
jgi:signal transduction histidine kinase